MSAKWIEKDGVIRFSVTSDGRTGEEWLGCFKEKGVGVGNYADNILRSQDFKPSSGVTTEIVVLRSMFLEGNDWSTEGIRVRASELGFSTPNAEVACLIREAFSDEEIEAMGFWCIVVMHEPIKDFEGDSALLDVRRHRGYPWLFANYGLRPNYILGFAFALPQVSGS